MTRQLGWWAGMVGAVVTALVGQAEMIAEPWRHYFTIAGIIATALSGYMIQRPSAWDGQTERRVSDATLSNIQKGERL